MRRAANPWDRFYRDQAAPWRGERDVEPLRPFLGSGRVLELGVGNGKLLHPLRRAGFDVVPLDISWHAMRRLGDGVLADASRLPFRDGCFSAVMDVHCTGHLDPAGRAAALRDQARVLAPGGHVVVRRLGVGDLRHEKGEVVDDDPDARRLQDGRVTHFTTEADLRAAVEAAGFEVVEGHTLHFHPRMRMQRVQRESVQVVARRV